MKKVITLGLVSALSTMLFIGCGSTTPAVKAANTPTGEKVHTGEIHKQHMTQEKVHKIIKKAGEDAGWKMTEFKSNTLIAEKTDGEASTSITITFSPDSFDVLPANSDLESVIGDALE